MKLVRLKPLGPGSDMRPDRRYNKHLQSRSRTTLGPEISREKICSLLKIFSVLKSLESDTLVNNLNV